MKDQELNNLFKSLHSEFDVETPNAGHQERFLKKLQQQKEGPKLAEVTPKTNYWKPLLGMVATIALVLTLIFVNKPQDDTYDLASVSPELANTQNFFTTTIATELKKLKAEATPETKALVEDAIERLDTLEKEYNMLRKDLEESGNDKRVIYAMISNFQTRIELLQQVLEYIEGVKQLKQTHHENISTI